jgi:CHAT domain-containing protein
LAETASAAIPGASERYRQIALGLRRAFALAGARSLITSPWPVADDASARWMREFNEAHPRDG